MEFKKIPASHIITQQFLTLIRAELSGTVDPGLGIILKELKQANLSLRFCAFENYLTQKILYLGVDLLSEENEEALLETFTHTANCEDLTFISQVGKIMVYGPHFGEVPGILGVTFSALSRSRVTPLAISASSSSLSWLFSPQQFKPALEVIYNLFEFPKNYSL